jgi:hypothetical protein
MRNKKERDLGNLDVKRFWKRSTPLTKILVLSLLMVLSGTFFKISALTAIGLTVLVVYIIYFLIWLRKNT